MMFVYCAREYVLLSKLSMTLKIDCASTLQPMDHHDPLHNPKLAQKSSSYHQKT